VTHVVYLAWRLWRASIVVVVHDPDMINEYLQPELMDTLTHARTWPILVPVEGSPLHVWGGTAESRQLVRDTVLPDCPM